MSIEISFVRCANHRRHYFQFDDATGIITFDHADMDILPPEDGCTANGEIFYYGTNYYAVADGASAYTEEILDPCSIVMDSVVSTPALDGANNGTITAAAHADGAVLYRLANGSNETIQGPQSSGEFINVPAGTWYLFAYEVDFPVCYVFQIITVDASVSLAATMSKTNVTFTGGNDGTLFITITGAATIGGVVDISIQPDWEAIPVSVSGTLPLFAVTRTGLTADTYTVLITDNISGQTLELSVIITGPPPVIPPDPPPGTTGNFLFFPMMNPFKFVEEAEVDDCSVFQTMDNTLFCKQKYPGFKCGEYLNKVAKCDIHTVQFQSNYVDSAHAITLRDRRTDEVIKTYNAITKETNINQSETFDITITLHEAGKSRVYFNTGVIPVPMAVGDSFEISDNADGFDGEYLIVSIQNDILLGAQYLVINKDYVIGDPSTSGKGTFSTDLVEFNILEFIVNDLGSVVNGDYYFKVVATSDEAVRTVVSEPMELLPKHEGTVLIEYRNFDNAFDMTWITGITCKMRVEATLFEVDPDSEIVTTRNSDGSLHKLSAKMMRQLTLYLWDLPPYMIEKLAIILNCDYWAVNKVRYQTEEKMARAKYRTRYRLASTQVLIEQVGWFKKNNSDDLGNVDVQEGLIIVNGGFLTR